MRYPVDLHEILKRSKITVLSCYELFKYSEKFNLLFKTFSNFAYERMKDELCLTVYVCTAQKKSNIMGLNKFSVRVVSLSHCSLLLYNRFSLFRITKNVVLYAPFFAPLTWIPFFFSVRSTKFMLILCEKKFP